MSSPPVVLADSRDAAPLIHHGEVLWRESARMGDAAPYGHTLGGAVGLCIAEADDPVKKEFVDGGEWRVNLARRAEEPQRPAGIHVDSRLLLAVPPGGAHEEEELVADRSGVGRTRAGLRLGARSCAP